MSIRFKEAIRLFKEVSTDFGAELIRIDETLAFGRNRVEKYLPKTAAEIDQLRKHNGKTQ